MTAGREEEGARQRPSVGATFGKASVSRGFPGQERKQPLSKDNTSSWSREKSHVLSEPGAHKERRDIDIEQVDDL